MPTRPKQAILPVTTRAWNEIAHDLANDLAALKLVLTAIGMTTDEQQRSSHLGTAKRLLTQGESRLDALRDAVRRRPEGTPKAPGTAGSKVRTSKSRRASDSNKG